MATTDNNATAPRYDSHPFDLTALIKLFIVGLATGIVGWLLYLAITYLFIQPVFCQSADTFSVCRNGGTIGWVLGHVIALVAAVAVLAKMALYRPLLIVIGVIASLWAAHAWLGGLTWYAGLIWQALLFGVAFAAFGWIARATNFALAVVLTLLLVIAARSILMIA